MNSVLQPDVRAAAAGWICPALKYAIMINGVTQLIMMKVDVLTIFDTIKVCTRLPLAGRYRLRITCRMIFVMKRLSRFIKNFAGWQQSLDGIHDFEAIPEELLAYVKFLEEELKLPITFISTGPDREALISREASALLS